MAWTPRNFNEACKRAAGRRAYNRKRRLARQRRITAILRLLDSQPPYLSGRDIARMLNVHEATISRDLKFIGKVQARYREMSGGKPMQARSFRWLRGGAWEIVYEERLGARVR